MSTLRLKRPIQDSRGLRLRGDPTVSSLEGLATRFDIPSFSQDLLTAMGLQARETGILGGVPTDYLSMDFETEAGTGRTTVTGGPKFVEPEVLNKRYEGLGLKFDRPMTESGARLLAEEKRAELIRSSIIRREPSGLSQAGVGLGVSLLNAAMDPLEIGAALIPVVGQARQAAWIARFGGVRGRMAVGLVEGTVGNVLTEPAYMNLSRSLQRDYGMSDALANVFIGGVLGTGIGASIGAGSRVRAGKRERLANMKREAAIGRAREELARSQRLLPETISRPSQVRPETAGIRVERKGNNFVTDSFTVVMRKKKGEKVATLEVRDRATKDVIETRTVAAAKASDKAKELAQELQSEVTGGSRVETPSTAARGEAVKQAVSQAAQGKQVRVQSTIRLLEDKNKLSRLKSEEKQLAQQIKFTDNILRRAKSPDVITRHADNLKRMKEELGEVRRRIIADEARQRATVRNEAARLAKEEATPERSPMYEPEQVSRLNEEAKKSDVPEDDEIATELQELRSQLEAEVEAGRMTEAELKAMNEDLERLNNEVGAMEKAAKYMQTCLRR